MAEELRLSDFSTCYKNNDSGVEIKTSKVKMEMYSLDFYLACTIGGVLSCGLTHMAVTPLDLVKCNMQV